jgi:Xaa-Pro aminopeptidase
MKNRVKELRNFIKSKNADAILINSADDFLSEYNILPLNSRYKVTGFSGSMGDCIVNSDNVYQIADGRYHEQADKEVDHNVVTVLKMQQGSSPIEEILNVLDKNSTLILTANKVPMQFCQTLEKKAAKKKIKISYILNDPIEDLAQNKYTNLKVVEILKSITKYSAEEKFKKLKLKDNEVLLITNPVDFAYFTNLRNFDFPYSAAPRAKAIVTNDEFEIFTDSKIPLKFDGLKIHKLSTFRKHLTNIREKSILVDKGALSQADFMQIHSSNKLKSSKIFELKSQKYNTEIVHLKSAFARTDKVLKKMDDLINSNKQLSEYDLYCAIIKYFEEEGAVSQSFKPIIASGTNSSIIHYSVASDKKMIKDGDMIMIDCGGYFEGGIATDITRTFVKGTPNDECKRIYTKVLKAFISTYTKKYSPDTTWQDIDLNTRKNLTDEEKNGYLFNHSTGHGIGISVHEFPPRCSFQDAFAKPFKKNYVFSIEPGLYKAGTAGVRLENAVYVKSVKPNFEIEVLSHYPFEKRLIDRSLLTKSEQKFLDEWQDYGKKNNLCN